VSYFEIAEAPLDRWRPRIRQELKDFLANFELNFQSFFMRASKIPDERFSGTALCGLLRIEIRHAFYEQLLARGIPHSVASTAMRAYDIDFYVPDD